MKILARKTLILAIVAVLIIVIIVGGYSIWQSGNSNPSATPSPSPSGDSSAVLTQAQVRDAVMAHVKSKYAETTPYMQSFTWTGGKVDTGLLGSDKYTYLSSGWNVTMQYPVVPNPTYTITANYALDNVAITWAGTWQNGTFTDTNYISNID